MSCGRTSATRPIIAGMATSIYDICASWPAPPNVAPRDKRSQWQEAEFGQTLGSRIGLLALSGGVKAAEVRYSERGPPGLHLKAEWARLLAPPAATAGTLRRAGEGRGGALACVRSRRSPMGA